MTLEGLAVGEVTVTGPGRYARIAPVGGTVPPQTPLTPRDLVVVQGDVDWSPAPPVLLPATGYRVRWGEPSVDEPLRIGTLLGTSGLLPASQTAYRLPVLPVGAYIVEVVEVNAAGASEVPAAVPYEVEDDQTEPPDTLPEAPRNVRTVANGSTLRVLHDGSVLATPPVTGYAYAFVSGPADFEADLVVTPVTPFGWNFAGLPDGDYSVDVWAVSSFGISPKVRVTAEVQTQTPTNPDPPAALSATPTSDGATVAVTASPSTGVTRYDWTSAPVGGGTTRTGTVLPSTPIRFTVTGQLGGTYVASVVAVRTVAGVDYTSTARTVQYSVSQSSFQNVDYTMVSGSNNAGLTAAALRARSESKRLRIFGAGTISSTWDIPAGLREVELQGTISLTTNSRGAVKLLGGSVGAQEWPISRWDQFDETITVPSPAGLAVNDLVLLLANQQLSHKPFTPGMLRRIVAINGTTVVLDKESHRTVESTYQHEAKDKETGAVTRTTRNTVRRLRKVTFSPSTTFYGSGIVQHGGATPFDWVACRHPLFQTHLCRDFTLELQNPAGGIRRNGQAGYRPGLNWGDRVKLSVTELIDDHDGTEPGLRGALYSFGYGIVDMGVREGDFSIRVRKGTAGTKWTVRHAYTTDHPQGLAGFDLAWMEGYGEAEDSKVHLDVEDSTSTGVNDHEPGWNIGYDGVIKRPGRHRANGDVDGKEGAGAVFFRSRASHILPTGLVVSGIPHDFSAVEIAERVTNQPASGFSLAEAPRLQYLTISDWQTTACVRVKQKVKLGPGLVINGPGGRGFEGGIGVFAESKWFPEGSQVVGPVVIRDCGIGIQYPAAFTSGLSNVTYPGTKSPTSG